MDRRAQQPASLEEYNGNRLGAEQGGAGLAVTGGVATRLSVISIKGEDLRHIHPSKMTKISVVGK